MSRTVSLASLSHRELENLLLTEHGALARILDRRPFVVAYTRGLAEDLGRRHASRNAVRWAQWSGVDA